MRIAVGLGTVLAAAAPSVGTDRPTTGGLDPGHRVLRRRHRGCRRCRPAVPCRTRPRGCLAPGGHRLRSSTAALIKDATHAWETGGVTGFFLAWQTYAFAATGVCALFLLDNAVQSGPLVASQPALTLGDALVSLVLGVTLYAERVRTGRRLIPDLSGPP